MIGCIEPRPTFEPLLLRCSKCANDWQGWQPNQVPFDTWIAHMRAQRCPHCGTRKGLLLRLEPETGENA